ncbi:MAG: anti-sigma factor, partial [Planctomycetes bacterium]|nr:anti-sigma factor [Planctomycetota bacterium]
PLSPDRARAALLADATGLVRCEWTPGPSPQRGEVRGDVVWDPHRQHGFLRLSGLPELDLGHRYQLWIVDGTRQGPPVDGGLLGPRGAATEVVVPIVAKLPVRQPAAFVLTVESADGVVVSAQEHVVAIAKP